LRLYNIKGDDKIYKSITYVLEVLQGQQFTSEVDIYGFGIITTEITIGKRAFDRKCPEIASEMPHCYIELAK
ncbi:16514_t:CDS:1, partial [Racocetra fulgida]